MKRLIGFSIFLLFSFSAYCQTSNLQEGINCFDEGDYICAIKKFEEVIKSSSGRDKQISEINLGRAKSCLEWLKIANQAFNQKNYQLAKENYQLVLGENPADSYSKEQLEKCNTNLIQKPSISDSKNNPSPPTSNQKKSIPNKPRNTIYSYEVTNNSDLLRFKMDLAKNLNSKIDKYRAGYLNLKYTIEFDTLGVNISAVNNLSTSLNNYQTEFESISKSMLLKPSLEGSYFIASKTTGIIDATWSTTTTSFKWNSNGFVQSNLETENISPIKNYIEKQPFKYGKYFFEIKSKYINNKSFTDINLVNYKIAGPESAFYSILMPGMGTLKVTYGEKGWKRFGLFLLSSAISVGSKIYSDQQYQKYLEAQDYSSSEKYYNVANQSQKIFLAAGSLSAAIYLYDVIWVISRGNKNLKFSKNLRDELKKNNLIEIQKQKIQL